MKKLKHSVAILLAFCMLFTSASAVITVNAATTQIKDYSEKDGYLFGIPSGTNAETLISKCSGGTFTVYDAANDEVFGKGRLATGMKLHQPSGTDLTVCVSGDINGDGKTTVTDVVSCCDNIVNGTVLSVPEKYTADLNGDEILNITDVVLAQDCIVKGIGDVNIHTPVEDNQFVGDSAAGKNRNIKIDCGEVINENFIGFGSNVFPANQFPDPNVGSKYNDAYRQLSTKRFASMNLHYTRMWFQVDWMITDTEPNPNRDDIQNNADYKNYKNGVYDLDGPKMQSVYNHIKMLNDAGTPVCLNFGWKNAKRVWKWFNVNVNGEYARNSVPRETDLYAKALVALLKELRKRKLNNVTDISFYNEPSYFDFQINDEGWSYESHVAEAIYWGKMYKDCYDAVLKAGLKPYYKMTACEESNRTYTDHGYTDYIKENFGNCVDAYTFHYYYRDAPEDPEDQRDYYNYTNLFKYYTSIYDKPLYVTEFYGASYNYESSYEYKWLDWKYSWAGGFIGTALSKCKVILAWTVEGGWLPDPQSWWLTSTINDSWFIPSSKERTEQVYRVFYEQSLYTNYVPSGSDVVKSEWSGEDLRVAAFRINDDDYTVIVEVDGTNDLVKQNSKGKYDYTKDYGERTLNFKFNEALGKVYKFEYDPATQETDARAIVNRPVSVMDNVGRTFSDTVDGNYAVYVYTTLQPIKQIDAEVTCDCVRGKYIFLTADMLDCADSDKITWSVTGSSNPDVNYTVSRGTGQFVPPSNAVKGDVVAVRASLVSNPRVFATVLVYII